MKAIAQAITLSASAFLAAVGCESTGSNDPLVAPMEISLSASSDSIAVGDTTTIVSQTRNMVGQDATIEWTSTGGEIEPQDGDRVARATFDRAGTYTVTARAMVDGAVVHSDSIEIRVRRIEPVIPRTSNNNNNNNNNQN